jgi:hypothetical protein
LIMSGSVTGYQAGIETTETQLSYVPESAWGTTPSAAFAALRTTGSSLQGSKSRTRPNEITGVRRVSSAITQQEQAGGAINFNLSYGTYDDFFAGALGNDWTAAQTIAGVSGDITVTITKNVLSSTTSNKFQNLVEGQWIELRGFTASAGANNGYYRIATKTNNQSLILAGRPVASTETPAGAAASVRNSGMLRNGDLVKSFTIQNRFAPTVWLRYAASMIAGFSLSSNVGQEFRGSFNIVSRDEVSAIAAAGNGTVNPAPTGGFFDTVAAFGGVQIDDTAPTTAVNSVSLTVSREGAGMDYGMGSAAAQGARWGQVQVAGQIELYFRDLTQYALFKNETRSRVSWRKRDPAGNSYIVTLPGSNLMNPVIQVGGPNQAILVRFDIEGGNDLALPAIQIDRFSA